MHPWMQTGGFPYSHVLWQLALIYIFHVLSRVLKSARGSAISRTLFEPHYAFHTVFQPPVGIAHFLHFLRYKALTNLTFVRFKR